MSINSERPLPSCPSSYHLDESPESAPEEEDPKKCRICLEEDGIFISPCSCSGSAGYIHRECLDSWRSTRPERMNACEICTFEFVIEIQGVSPAMTRMRNFKYTCFVTWDIIVIVFMIHVPVAILGAIAYAADKSRAIPTGMHTSQILGYYVFGWCLFLICVGLAGLVIALLKGSAGNNCCICVCDGGDECALPCIAAMGIILLLFGLFIGMFFFVEHMNLVREQRHAQIYRHLETAVYIVKDRPLECRA